MSRDCREISTSGASRGRGPYPQALVAAPFVFLSGQGPLSAETNQPVSGSFAEQVRLTMANVTAILAAAGLTLTDVVKITVYLSDLDRVHEFNQLYVEYFEEHRPARTLVQVGLRNIEIELDIIAMDMQDATLPQGRSRRHGE